MKTFNTLTEQIAKKFLVLLFTVVFCVGLFIKPMYNFDDSPYFESTKLMDIIMLMGVSVIFGIVFYFRETIQKYLKTIHILVLFVIIALLYIYLVPLKPFSDMLHIYETAKDFATFHWDNIGKNEYWTEFPSNIRVGIFWGILLIPFPKTLWTMKILNAVFIFAICYLTGKICKELGMKYYNIVFLGMVCYIPLILYINHAYYDMPLVFLCIAALYIYIKKQSLLISAVLLCIATYLRSTGLIFLIAIGIDYIIKKYQKNIENKQVIKSIIVVILTFLVVYTIGKTTGSFAKNTFISEQYPSYSVWNFYYIGMNESEFGFMDNDFDLNRKPEDLINRLEDYGAYRIAKIYAKKIEWTWMQGTYQAQRYGLGPDVQETQEKFEYDTVLTGHLLNDDQLLRRALNAFMRAQYIIFFFLMLITLWKQKNIDDLRIIYYILFGTVFILIFWEMKSRYIIHCLPLIAILACKGMEYLEVEKLRLWIDRVKIITIQ